MKTAMKKPPFAAARLLLGALLLAGLLSGCMKNYGQVRLDPDITGMFVEGRVPADYHYYINGRDHMPYAIVGIKPDYTFAAKFWEPVTPNTEAFRKMARNAWTTADYNTPVGGYLLAPDGTQIGLWYSCYRWPTIKMADGNAVIVYSPYKPDGSYLSRN